MSVGLVLVVGLGGAAGACARFASQRIAVGKLESSLELVTLAVNTSGSVLLGVVAGMGSRLGSLPAEAIGTGFCGGFTTFSTFSQETLSLIEERQLGVAAGYLLSSLMAGLVGAWLGIAIGSAL